MKKILQVFTVCLSLFMLACDDQSSEFCLSNQQSVQVGLYSSYQTTDKDSTVSDLVVYSLGVDSILYDSVSINKLYLPLNMLENESQFIFKLDGKEDTVTFIHDKELDFVSGECGFIFKFYLDTVKYSDYSFIHTAIINDDEVIYNENFENVKIYLY